MLWCGTQILLQDGGAPSLSFSSGDAPCWAPCWELPLAADTCLTQGDTSFPGEPTSKDQLASVKGLSSSLLCSPTQALGLPRGWVEAFAEAASPFKCFCSVLRPSLSGRCWTPTHSLRTNPHQSVFWEIQPTLTTSTFFSAFAAQNILVNIWDYEGCTDEVCHGFGWGWVAGIQGSSVVRFQVPSAWTLLGLKSNPQLPWSSELWMAGGVL